MKNLYLMSFSLGVIVGALFKGLLVFGGFLLIIGLIGFVYIKKFKR